MIEDYYVYCLIDPRNDHPFYVGKGKLDRGESHLNEPEGRRASKKEIKISEIRKSGKEPYVRRFMWNLTENAAFAVETVLIDEMGDHLTNENKGNKISSLRCRSQYTSWTSKFPGVDYDFEDFPGDFLDSEDETRSIFPSKLKAYQATGSNHESARGHYHIHSISGIKMWTGQVRAAEKDEFPNEYDSETGNFYIDPLEVRDVKTESERRAFWDKWWYDHETKHTFNKKEKNNEFLCFAQGVNPNTSVTFLGVYKDNRQESEASGRFVRSRVNTQWKIPARSH